MQWQLEGPVLEDLLLEVEDTYAGAARILAAEKVRRGGIAGFFAREHFEVTVEVPDPAAGADATATGAMGDPGAGADSLLDLADRMSDREAATVHQPEAAARAETARAKPPAVSTEEQAFESVLTRLTNLTADPSAGDSATTDPAPAAASAPLVTPLPDGLLPSPRLPAWPTVIRSTAATAAAALQVTTASPVQESDPAGGDVRPAAVPADAWRFRRIGVPAALLRSAPSDLGAEELLGFVCDRVPGAPVLRLRRGDVLAVVGDGPQALLAAQTVAGLLDIPAEGVRLASRAPLGGGPRLTSAEAVERRRKVWQEQSHPTVLAVNAGRRPRDTWVGDVLAAAGPTTVWQCVSATTKPGDAAAMTSFLRPKALVVTDWEHSGDPASVLALEVPVAVLDGEEATAELWRERLQTCLGDRR